VQLRLSTQQLRELNRVIALAQKLGALAQQLVENDKRVRLNGWRNGATRIRRTGKELVQFRRMLKNERKKGAPVAELARKHGVTRAYIYMLQ
jgi:hypothetical protein